MKNTRVIGAFAAGLLTALGVGIAIGDQSQTAQTGPLRALDFAALKGAKEIGTDGENNAGDRNGRGSFSAIIDGDKLCYGLTVANIGKPVAAHIHKGPRAENGDVVQTLKHPRAGDPGASSECTNIESSLADDVGDNPRGFYVNVHNAKFPGGAVRGQLFTGGG